MFVDCYPDIPKEWDKKPFFNIATINPKYKIDKNVFYPFVEMASVNEGFGGISKYDSRIADSSGLARFKEKDILFAKITPCAENGKVALVKNLNASIGLGSTEFIVLSPNNGNDPKFVYALACSNPVHGRAIARMEGSTGRLRIRDDTFTKWLMVPVPPPKEQQAIARILDAVDTAIQQTRVEIEKALKLQKGLIQSLLKYGINEDGKLRNVSNKKFISQKNKYGVFPKEWSFSKVDDEFDLQTGFTLNQNRVPRFNKKKYLRVANVQRGFILLDDIAELEATDEETIKRTLMVNDLLIVEGHADPNQIGRCALVCEPATGLTFQNHLYRLRSKRLNPIFASLWLNSEYAQIYWKRMCATSSGLNTINQRKLKALMIPVPDEKEQIQISQVSIRLDEYVQSLIEKHDRYIQLKKGLMQDLLTGNVRVNV